ncbi:MAG: hypothetical protein K0M60_01415 [Hydrogenophaga sp.]|nr:hypothetical protein [Hydrogenophaga sp.]
MTDGIFKLICWLLASYFLYAAIWPVFPPPDITEKGNYVFLLLAAIFFLVPNAKKIEFFQFFSFEAKIKEVEAKAEIADAKAESAQAEVRHLQMITATLTNSLSSINTNSNQFNVHLHDAERQAAFQGVGLPTASTPATNVTAEHRPTGDDSGPIGSSTAEIDHTPLENLILLRTDLEIAMRKAVGRNLDIYKSRKNAKFLTMRQLSNMIINQYNLAAELAASFDFFQNAANAAAHGQEVPEYAIDEALVVGNRLLDEVKKLTPVPAGSKEPGDQLP